MIKKGVLKLYFKIYFFGLTIYVLVVKQLTLCRSVFRVQWCGLFMKFILF